MQIPKIAKALTSLTKELAIPKIKDEVQLVSSVDLKDAYNQELSVSGTTNNTSGVTYYSEELKLGVGQTFIIDYFYCWQYDVNGTSSASIQIWIDKVSNWQEIFTISNGTALKPYHTLGSNAWIRIKLTVTSAGGLNTTGNAIVIGRLYQYA